MKYAFAGDRDISVAVLQYMITSGFPPAALLISEPGKASHAKELVAQSGLETTMIFIGKEFKELSAIKTLTNLDLDYIIGIHFPYIIPTEVLRIPKIGFLNLHPAYLPFNKGWHTPSWAILEDTPYGATLHYMTEELDAGDIIHQKACIVLPSDTADSLYKKVKKIEFEVFIEAFPQLLSLNPPRIKQSGKGTSHTKKDLQEVKRIELDKPILPMVLINQLRALTTNDMMESSYFICDGSKYNIQIHIKKNDN